VNCANCHFPGGPVPAAFDARLSRPLAEAGLIIHGALVNNLGNTNNRVIVPGLLTNSALYLRASTRGSIKMPPLGSTVVDTQGMAVVAAWITGSA
jgi:mono/diheme cytochrome c family protein